MRYFSTAHAVILRVLSWFSSISCRNIPSIGFTIGLLLVANLAAPAQSRLVTTTALAVSSSSGPVTTVASGTIVTLKATVTPASGTITAGQVNFCDVSARLCTDIHLLGTAQLTNGGIAALRLRAGIGSHSFRAVFLGTHAFASSISSTSGLTVIGKYPTTTAISNMGIPNDYTLTATLTGVANISSAPSPSGSISFVDSNHNNAVLSMLPVGSSTTSLSFVKFSNPATVSEPNVAAAADFNRDGIVDLAVSNSNSGGTTLTILLGNGDGTFTAVATSPTVGLYPDGIAVGDFNGDGKPDLAVNSVDQGEVVLLLGNGDGTFLPGQVLNTLTSPQSIATADLNGDGIADLAVVNANSILIFLGNGDGTFATTSPSLPTGMSPISVVAGDFNSDGVADLAVVNSCGNAYPCNNNAGTVSIFLGKGDGTFTAVSATPTTGSAPAGLAAADFNGDGVLDLVVTNYGIYGNDAITILLGKGDGTFDAGVFYSAAGMNFKSVAVADLNGDGIADLAVGTFWRGMYTLLGHGDGTFDAGQPVIANVQSTSGYITTADFDGDGVPDIAMPDQNVAGTVAILLAQNTRSFTVSLSSFSLSGPGLHEVAASYAGGGNYLPSTSPTTGLQVKVADPVFSVASGTYTTEQTLTISETTPGAVIYYAIYGVNPYRGVIQYAGPITLPSGQTIVQAYATETGYLDSNQISENFTLYLPPATVPVISLPSGYYSGPQTVTITDSDTSAKIYYTTNGTYPTTGSNLYSGPISVSASETLAAAAMSYAHSDSPFVFAQYVIGSSTAAMIYSIAGSGMIGYSGDGGPATLAQTHGPNSLVKDASGNIYFSDESNHMVRKIAAGTSIISLLAGNGLYGYSGDGGPATSAELGYPSSLALDSASLYIADDNATVRKVDLISGTITTYAGNGTPLVQGDGGPATAAGLGSVTGIAIDASHNLYIANGYAGTIRQVDGATGIISTIAGNGVPGYSGDLGPAISAAFRTTYGLAFDASGSLYIADPGNELIRKITATNGMIGPSSIISTVAGTPPSSQYTYPVGGYSGDGGLATSAQLNSPVAVAVDSSGNLFIADEFNSAIRKVAAANGNISTVAGNGLCIVLGGDGGVATGSSLCYPWGIAVDSVGDLFIADALSRIREVVPAAAPPKTQAATPTFSVTAGNYATPQSITISDATPGVSIYVTVDGSTPTTTSAGYSLPINVAAPVTIKAVATGPGYLTSAVTSARYNVTAFAPLITTVAGSGIPGFIATAGPALSTMFSSPKGIAFAKSGNLYVADTGNNVIWIISSTSGTASIFAGTGTAGYTGDGGPATSAALRSPAGLAFDNAGNLYVADSGNNVVREIAASTGIVSTVAGGSTAYGFIGDGGPATSARLEVPAAVAFDGANNLYIADTYNRRIREVTASTGIITTVAGNGAATKSGDGGLATSAGLLTPDSLAVDLVGNIYFASSNGAVVRKVTASTGIINAIAGLKDLAGQTSDNGPAIGAEVNPRALALDAAGNLYISNAPGEIRKIDVNTGIISSVAGIGFPGYSGDGGAAAVAQIYYPAGIAFDAVGNLYFADSMDRIRKVTFVTQAAATPAFSVPAGTYTTSQSVALTDSSPNATIYYTTDGSTPSVSSNAYTTPITVSSSQTINAIAIAVAYNPSAVASATYVLNTPAPPSLTSLSPAYASAGGAQFTLTINGSGFTGASSAYWGTSALPTQFVSSSQLTSTVPATGVSTAGIAVVTVQTPSLSGGASNALQFEVDTAGPGTPPSFSTTSATLSAGGTASYPVTLPASATEVSVRCLNLPTGASCSYSASLRTMTITTTSTTPTGTYVITTVFTETLPGAAVALILLPFLLAPLATKRRNAGRFWLLMIVGMITVGAVLVGCGGGGGSGGGTNSSPSTHQVTSSSVVTLIVK